MNPIFRLAQRVVCAALPLVLATSAAAADFMHSSLVGVSPLALTRSADTVVFSGQVVVKSRLAKDPDFGEVRLLFDIDLAGVKGINQASKAVFVTDGSAQIVMPLARTQVIEVTFPYARSADMPLSATRSGRAQLTLDVDVTTGAVMSGLVSIVDR
jgi:hypothetical protein